MSKGRAPDSYNSKYDAPNPRLATLKQIRWENKIRDELTGEDVKKSKSKVSLPKFSWEKKDG
jgi:hypothetical protein